MVEFLDKVFHCEPPGRAKRCGRKALRKRGGKEHRLVPIVRLDSMEYCPRTNREEPTWGEAPRRF